MPIITLQGFKCCRCNYEWLPRKGTTHREKTKVCPNCKSPYWDVPRRRQSPEVKDKRGKSQ